LFCGYFVEVGANQGEAGGEHRDVGEAHQDRAHTLVVRQLGGGVDDLAPGLDQPVRLVLQHGGVQQPDIPKWVAALLATRQWVLVAAVMRRVVSGRGGRAAPG